MTGTASISSDQKPGLVGCGGFILVLAITLVCMGLLGLAIWWGLRDVGVV